MYKHLRTAEIILAIKKQVATPPNCNNIKGSFSTIAHNIPTIIDKHMSMISTGKAFFKILYIMISYHSNKELFPRVLSHEKDWVTHINNPIPLDPRMYHIDNLWQHHKQLSG